MILDIVTYPDPRLKQVCAEVPVVTDELRTLAQDMLETMYDAPGVGLAAPQVGHTIRLLVMDPFAGEEDAGQRKPLVLFNPVLELSGEDIKSEQEGCLSVPLSYRADVQRKSHVHYRALGLDGKPVEGDLDGFAAIVIQHEADHLDGKLFIDRISHLRRMLYDGKVRKWLKQRDAG